MCFAFCDRQSIWAVIASVFFRTGVFIFGFTAVLKFISITSEAQVLRHNDPVFFFLTNRQVLFLAGGIETVVCCLLLKHVNNTLKATAMACLATLFLNYRIGLWLVGYTGPCPCVGNVFGWLKLSQKSVDSIMIVILAYIIVGSYSLVLHNWLKNRPTATNT